MGALCRPSGETGSPRPCLGTCAFLTGPGYSPCRLAQLLRRRQREQSRDLRGGQVAAWAGKRPYTHKDLAIGTDDNVQVYVVAVVFVGVERPSAATWLIRTYVP